MQKSLITPTLACQDEQVGKIQRSKPMQLKSCCYRQCRHSWLKEHGAVDFGPDIASIKSKQQSLGLLFCVISNLPLVLPIFNLLTCWLWGELDRLTTLAEIRLIQSKTKKKIVQNHN